MHSFSLENPYYEARTKQIALAERSLHFELKQTDLIYLRTTFGGRLKLQQQAIM